MKNIQSSNDLGQKSEKMTLKDYYNSLPDPVAPKSDFLREVSERCGVTITTVRNWCIYGMKPNSYKAVKVLEELTGISEEELWAK